ncbi:MAG: hypothetical protein WDM80_11620 [Limisphaerales bacterium]
MYLVFKTIHGQIEWEDRFEVESLEEFVQSRNKRVRESGSNRDLFSVDSPFRVKEIGGDGKTVGTYHVCEAKGSRLI